MKIKIISPGMLTTVQDSGRFGYMSFGFSPNGAMDLSSFKTANILVGNSPDEGALELTLTGITAEFDCDCVIALTGADMQPILDSQEIPMNEAVQVKKGSVLKMGAAKSQMRAYLAVAGGFDLPLVMGSMSTNLKCKLGGFGGRALKANDEIPLKASTTLSLIGHRKIKPEQTVEAENEQIILRVLLGPQDDYFTENGIETFFGCVYTVSDKSDRMGIRLSGAPVETKSTSDIISDGVATGSIQIPASGTPIIMMADRQTTGGYAKIATVISPDLSKIAQAKPGAKVRFVCVTQKEAEAAFKREQNRFNMLEYENLFTI